MKSVIKLLLSIILIFVLSECSKMPICQSHKLVENNEINLQNTSFIDNDNNLLFKIMNDESNLQVTLRFDSLSLEKIQRDGFYIYFDPKGKKKKNISLRILPKQKEQKGDMGATKEKLSSNNFRQSNRSFIPQGNSFINNLTSAVWQTKDNIYAFDIRFLTQPIHVTTQNLKTGQWQLTANIPLKELSDQPILYLALGVETPRQINNSRPSGRMGGGMQGGGGMPGGGMRGGGMGAPPMGAGGGMTPNGSMHGNMQKSDQLISWIKVELN